MYRIYTENTKIKTIKRLCNNNLNGYTLIKSQGIWQGKEEKSIIIEVEGARKKQMIHLSKLLKKALKQEVILLQELKTKNQLI